MFFFFFVVTISPLLEPTVAPTSEKKLTHPRPSPCINYCYCQITDLPYLVQSDTLDRSDTFICYVVYGSFKRRSKFGFRLGINLLSPWK